MQTEAFRLHERDETDRVFAPALVAAATGGLLIGAMEFIATRGTVAFGIIDQFEWLARLAVHWALAALPVGIAVALLEKRTSNRVPSVRRYGLAIVAGASVGALVMALHGKFVDVTISRSAVGFDMDIKDRFLYGFWQLSFWGAVGAALHAATLRQQRTAIALRSGELARLQSEGALQEAQLQALHSQIEPEFLLMSLNTVEQLYELDVAAGDRALDALIRFLHLAMPLLRMQRSTVRDEARLLKAYTQTLGPESNVANMNYVDVDEYAGSTPISAGVLFSLVQKLLKTPPLANHKVALDLRAHSSNPNTVVDISVIGAPLTEPAILGAFVTSNERRLKLSCGGATMLELLCEQSGIFTLRVTLTNNREPKNE